MEIHKEMLILYKQMTLDIYGMVHYGQTVDLYKDKKVLLVVTVEQVLMELLVQVDYLE